MRRQAEAILHAAAEVARQWAQQARFDGQRNAGLASPEQLDPLYLDLEGHDLLNIYGHAEHQHAENQRVETPVGEKCGLERGIEDGADTANHRQRDRHPEKGVSRVEHGLESVRG